MIISCHKCHQSKIRLNLANVQHTDIISLFKSLLSFRHINYKEPLNNTCTKIYRLYREVTTLKYVIDEVKLLMLLAIVKIITELLPLSIILLILPFSYHSKQFYNASHSQPSTHHSHTNVKYASIQY